MTGNLPANTLLVAFVSANNGNSQSPNTIVNNVTNQSGVLLTWQLAQRSNAQLGTAEIWWAFSPAAHASTTVRAVLNHSESASITVMAFTGADPTLVGAGKIGVSAASGGPAAGITTTRSNSLVFGVGTDWDNPRVLTPGAGQTIVNQFNPTSGDTYWVQRLTAPVLTPGFVTLTDTYTPAAMPDRWDLALIEIRRQP